MVDSPKEETMDGASNLPERVQVIEQKLDALAVSVDSRFEQVSAAIAEQRAYTEYVYERLDQKMDAGFANVEEGFARVDGRFARLERKIDQIIDLHAPRTPPNESDAE